MALLNMQKGAKTSLLTKRKADLTFFYRKKRMISEKKFFDTIKITNFADANCIE